MPLTAQDRVAEIAGKSGSVRIIRKGRKNSRVVAISPTTGQEIGARALVANERLRNIRFWDELQTLPDDVVAPQLLTETSKTIRISASTWLALQRLAQPFETPDEVVRRLLPPTHDSLIGSTT